MCTSLYFAGLSSRIDEDCVPHGALSISSLFSFRPTSLPEPFYLLTVACVLWQVDELEAEAKAEAKVHGAHAAKALQYLSTAAQHGHVLALHHVGTLYGAPAVA